MTIARSRLLTVALCAIVPACATSPPVANTAYLPPGVFGVYEDNATGAINQSSWAFAGMGRIRGDPIDAARAVIAVEYLADELRGNPRWIGLSMDAKMGMVRARTATRQALGIAPDAPPRLVVLALLRFAMAWGADDQAAAIQTLRAPVFTLPPDQTMRLLYDLPYIRSANLATLEVSSEALSH
jgi:hypothetical protein